MEDTRRFAPLLNQYRGGYLECTHFGIACIVNEEGVVQSYGDPNWYSFYRSASKPIQSLPTVMAGLPEKYGLTMEETAIFSGSHWGEPHHIEILESICEKTGLKEEDLIMLPTYPLNEGDRNALIRSGKPQRKLYHNCSGKHLCLMLLSRELGENIQDYWKTDSKAQAAILDVISKLTDIPVAQIHIGVDGCGVPVYGVPIHTIAKSFLRLACPDLIQDPDLAKAVAYNRLCIRQAPSMLDGLKGPCATMSRTGDMIVKAGALGVHALGCASKRLGVVVKLSDGNDSKSAFCTAHIAKAIGCDDATARDLDQILPSHIYNDNKLLVGEQRCTIFD